MTVRDHARAARRVATLTWHRGEMLVATRGRGRPICADVAEWAERDAGISPTVLLRAREIERQLPSTVEPSVHEAYSSRVVARQPARRLTTVHDARLVGRRALVVLADGSFAAESAWGEPPLAHDRDFLSPRRRRVVRKPGNWCSLVIHPSGTRNYYHWFHDVLTRLHGVLDHIPADTRFVVPPKLRDFQRESLRYLGITDDQLEPFTGDEIWELDTLHFAPQVSNVGSDREEVDHWLRATVLDGAGVTSRSGDRRVAISRRQAPKRRVVNEDAVTDLLRRHGFETVIPEDLSLHEQVALFAQTAVLVAPHGAGLTNMLFAPPGLTVVEMVDPGMLDVAYIYWAMAGELGHEYWYLVTDSVPHTGQQHDCAVPIEKLEATLLRAGVDTR